MISVNARRPRKPSAYGAATKASSRVAAAIRTEHPGPVLGGARKVRLPLKPMKLPAVADEEVGRAETRLADLLDDLHARGHSVVIATHDALAADRADRCIHLVSGTTRGDRP